MAQYPAVGPGRAHRRVPRCQSRPGGGAGLDDEHQHDGAAECTSELEGFRCWPAVWLLHWKYWAWTWRRSEMTSPGVHHDDQHRRPPPRLFHLSAAPARGQPAPAILPRTPRNARGPLGDSPSSPIQYSPATQQDAEDALFEINQLRQTAALAAIQFNVGVLNLPSKQGWLYRQPLVLRACSRTTSRTREYAQ